MSLWEDKRIVNAKIDYFALFRELRENERYKMIGDNSENLTMRLPCREVFARGQ
ncbi:MAG: hypothetical protein RBT80_12915 [Candidatus Vecturithrix sp.]|nr:hypothetical protein [Candidatus Vecturithrix sp.]